MTPHDLMTRPHDIITLMPPEALLPNITTLGLAFQYINCHADTNIQSIVLPRIYSFLLFPKITPKLLEAIIYPTRKFHFPAPSYLAHSPPSNNSNTSESSTSTPLGSVNIQVHILMDRLILHCKESASCSCLYGSWQILCSYQIGNDISVISK